MGLTLVWVAVLALVVVGVILVVQQQAGKNLAGRPKPDSLPAPSLHRTVFTLQIGDIVQYQGSDWVVEGKLTFDDHGFTWLEYMLQDGDRIRWLGVEEDDRVEVCWMEDIDDLEVTGSPPAALTYNGITYRKGESGTAKMTRMGTLGTRQGQTCRYVDYEAEGDRKLSLEYWNDNLEVTVGYLIRPSSLMLLPGDGRRVYDD
jgi:hypothetical protein